MLAQIAHFLLVATCTPVVKDRLKISLAYRWLLCYISIDYSQPEMYCINWVLSLPIYMFCIFLPSGLYMSDLTFTDNGNPNFHSDGLINFSKCRLIYNQIRDLILRQVCTYIHL